MTPQEKVEDLIQQLGVVNAIYLVDTVIFVIEEYENPINIQYWRKIKLELELRLKQL